MWYMVFLPIVFARNQLWGDYSSLLVFAIGSWVMCDALCLYFFYQIEFFCKNMFYEAYAATHLFFAAQLFLLLCFIALQ